MKIKGWSKFSLNNSEKNKFNTKVFLSLNSSKTYIHRKKSLKNFLKTNQHTKDYYFSFCFRKIPFNYNFEVIKTVKKINELRSRKIFIQLPEGLQKYYKTLSDTFGFHGFFSKRIVGSNQTTYGACCIDDLFFKTIGTEICFHYGHSCLIPISHCIISISYIFLEIYFDSSFFIESMKNKIFKKEIAWNLLATIQFITCLKKVQKDLSESLKKIIVPQSKPLSPGEILGCTSPHFKYPKNIVYFGDGRFHIESAMISSFNSRFFNYNPFSHSLFMSDFTYKEYKKERGFILFKSLFHTKNLGLLIGNLGRQGSVKIYRKIKEILANRKILVFPLSLKEIYPDNLNIFGVVILKTWAQIACPRLSCDWGKYFNYPLVSPYELCFLMGFTSITQYDYLMNYFSEKGSFWTSNAKSSSRFYLS